MGATQSGRITFACRDLLQGTPKPHYRTEFHLLHVHAHGGSMNLFQNSRSVGRAVRDGENIPTLSDAKASAPHLTCHGCASVHGGFDVFRPLGEPFAFNTATVKFGGKRLSKMSGGLIFSSTYVSRAFRTVGIKQPVSWP